MTYFITKVWGWQEPIGPLVFAEDGWRRNALGKLQPGDQVILVGTSGEPTDPSEQGRLLGIMEPTELPVMSLDYPREYRARDYDEQGRFKWPYGLLNARAWTLLDRPLLKRISARTFGRDAVMGIVPLSAEEGMLVDDLARREAEMAEATAKAQDRIERATGRRTYSAPPPSTSRAGVMHMRRARAYTYMMELIGAEQPSFKIGWAFDWQQRERTFNHAALPELGGIQYKTRLHHLWDTARQAFSMEQAMLRRFQSQRHEQNNEVVVGIDRREIERAWVDQVVG